MERDDLSRIDLVEVSAEPIDIARLVAAVADPGAGATVVFVGTVRDSSPGHPDVSRLEYEAYGEVVADKIAAVVGEVRGRWPVLGVALQHRVGTLSVGEVTVAAVVSAPHRDQAFPAARHLIDSVKASAPIWKKEHWSGGAEWVRESAHAPDPDGGPADIE